MAEIQKKNANYRDEVKLQTVKAVATLEVASTAKIFKSLGKRQSI